VLANAHMMQAREENYVEVLAFVRLLNELLRVSGDALPDKGRAYAHFAQFVRDDVLGHLAQRVFR
jgi:hypothetical protein